VIAFSPEWQAVALRSGIGRKPVRVMFHGQPVVLFDGAQGLAALVDRCPHRLVPLSGGKAADGQIECPYHGWRFDEQGLCRGIPGHVGTLPTIRAQRFAVCERGGVVFLANPEPALPPYLHCMDGQPAILRLVQSRTQSTLIDAAENILDATHTHYTHKGLLRGLSQRRQLVQVDVTGGDGWVEARYVGEEHQQGFISKLLEGARVKTIGRFRAPGIAELEYWGPHGLVLATTFHLRQADAQTVEGIGLLTGPRNGLLDHLKALAFRPLFAIALKQDQRVLHAASRNAAMAPDVRAVIGPLDFLRRDIAAILQGALPPAATTARRHQIML
jgi:phenylpropionate dioxygenase-like ring-hydroxylating dioxygenase large terminal subunit